MERVLDQERDLERPGAAPSRVEDLLAACYEDMRRVARAIMAHDGMRARLQPTDLVNEAALRLIQSMPAQVADRGHMLAVAGRTMRRVLIDEARRYRAAKRSPPPLMTQFPGGERDEVVDIEDLDRALAAVDEPSFGTCANCGRPIGFDRLTAVPTTTVCVSCAATGQDGRGTR